MDFESQDTIEPEFSPVESPDRWDGSYGTGRTEPPKRYTGLVAVLLMCVIFCGGMVGGLLLSRRSADAAPTEPTQDSVEVLSGHRTHPDKSDSFRFDEQERTMAMSEGLVIAASPEAVPNVASDGGLSLQDIYKKVSPSVVSITSDIGSGSGIIMSKQGYIITNCHVVSGARELTVLLADGREYPAELRGKDSLSDLAVLQIDAPRLSPAEFGDSDAVQVGDSVTAIGDPLGIELRGTMTEGIVSAINRNLTIQGRDLTLIQTTAALNEGNSGGPLINCFGQVIGINTAKIGSVYSSAGVEGLGFAIPIDLAKEVVDSLISLGYVPGRPSLGVETTILSYEYQMWFGLPEGLYITEVAENSAPWEAGLRQGDVITYLDGQRITTQETLTAALSTHTAGDTVEVVIWRSHRQYQGKLTLQEAGE